MTESTSNNTLTSGFRPAISHRNSESQDLWGLSLPEGRTPERYARLESINDSSAPWTPYNDTIARARESLYREIIHETTAAFAKSFNENLAAEKAQVRHQTEQELQKDINFLKEQVLALKAPSSKPYRKVSELKPIPMYGGSQRKNAAQKWLQECEMYFEKERVMARLSATEDQKIFAATERLTGEAMERWLIQRSSVKAGLRDPIVTWSGFVEWILFNFPSYGRRKKKSFN